MGLETKDQLRQCRQRTPKTVHLDELDDDVFIRLISGREMVEFREWVAKADAVPGGTPITKMNVYLAWLCLCNKNSERIYNDAADLADLENLPASALEKIRESALSYNGLPTLVKPGETAPVRDEMRKNSMTTESGSGGSESLAI